MKVYIIKIGGNVIDDEQQLFSFLSDFAAIKEFKILIHGGGKIATELGKQLGIEARMVEGRRITDGDTLKVVQMVYAGLINKNVVAQLQSRNCNAIGLTGADANIILAKKRSPLSSRRGVGTVPIGTSGGEAIDYGFVGDVEKVNAEKLSALLNAGLFPVMAPLTHDGKGQMLNTNADTIAASVAAAMPYDTTLIYCFEKPGVLKNVDDDNSIIEKMNFAEYEKYKSEGIISKGMIPKLDNAFEAIKQGVKSVIICHAKDLTNVIRNGKVGTKLN